MKKIDFNTIIFLITSLLILMAGFVMPILNPNVHIAYSICGAAIVILFIILDIKAPKIVNLSEDNPKVKTFRFLNRFALFIAILCLVFSILFPTDKLTISKDVSILIVGLVSVFMMVMGNLSPKIPHNRYLGLRLPWTIKDEQTWRIAHKIMGYSSFPIAIIMFISTFFFDINIVVSVSVLTWVIVPSIYSFIFYYKKIKGLN